MTHIKNKDSLGKVIFIKTLFPFLLKINITIFPYLVVLTYALLCLETVTYRGFVERYLFVSVYLILLLTLIGAIGVFFKKGVKTTETSTTNLILKMNSLLIPVFAIFYWILVLVEATHYPNYVYSTFHILPENLGILLFFSIYLFVIKSLRQKNLKNIELLLTSGTVGLHKYPGSSKMAYSHRTPFQLTQRIIISVIIFLLGIYGLYNTIKVLDSALKSNIFILRNLNLTYEEKMKTSWNFFYDYIEFVRENTPVDAVIAIPPSIRPWLSEGNSVLVRYFLYPRKLKSDDELKSKSFIPNYYLLAKGLWGVSDEKMYGWPKENISAEWVIYFDGTTKQVKRVEGNYNPNDQINTGAWGLIKVKEEKE